MKRILLTIAYDGTNYSGWQKQKHALGQRAVIDVETSIPAEKIPLAIRSFLPADIVVTKAEEVAETFHPRFDCVKKTYEYRFWNAPAKNPKERLYSAYVQKPLDVERMNEGAKAFLGTHDFAAFCAAGAQVSTTVRTIFDCHVEKRGESVRILVTGDGFLYNMVRILVGTLLFVSEGKIDPADLPAIIESGERMRAGKTAPPQGLYLNRVEYDPADFKM